MVKTFLKRWLSVWLIILAFPVLASVLNGDSKNSYTPFAPVCFAGHSVIGDSRSYCQCGALYCICDPGETPGSRQALREPEKNTQQETPSAGLGSEMLLALAALMMLLKFRA